MNIEESAQLKHLKKVCEVQQNFIDGKIDKETYQKQIHDANCTYKFYLQAETEKLRIEKMQMDMAVHFSKLLSGEKNMEAKDAYN